MFSMDMDPVVIPIVLIVLYFFGYFLYLGLRRLIKRLVNQTKARRKGEILAV
jgi:hypothetical protein